MPGLLVTFLELLIDMLFTDRLRTTATGLPIVPIVKTRPLCFLQLVLADASCAQISGAIMFFCLTRAILEEKTPIFSFRESENNHSTRSYKRKQ